MVSGRRCAIGSLVVASGVAALAVWSSGAWTRGEPPRLAAPNGDGHDRNRSIERESPDASSSDALDSLDDGGERRTDPAWSGLVAQRQVAARSTRTPLVEVTDEAGEPIAGAWVEVDSGIVRTWTLNEVRDDFADVGWPTDDDDLPAAVGESFNVVVGQTYTISGGHAVLATLGDGIARSIEPIERITSVRCRHPGFLPAERTGPFGDGPIHLALERADVASEIHVRILGADGSAAPAPRLDCVLVDPEPIASKAWRAGRSSTRLVPRHDGLLLAIDAAFEELPIELVARARGHLSRRVRTKAPRAGDVSEVEIQLEPQRLLLRGRVVDRRSAHPLDDARVDARWEYDATQGTDSRGGFAFDDVEGARIVGLRVQADGCTTGYFPASAFDALRNDGELVLPLDEESGTIEVSVRDAAGYPLVRERIEARHLWPDGSYDLLAYPRTGDDGRVTLRGLPTTAIEVVRVGESGRTSYDFRTVDPSDGATVRCDFVVRPGVTLKLAARLDPLLDGLGDRIELFLFEVPSDGGEPRLVAHDAGFDSVRSIEGIAAGRHLLRLFNQERHVDRVVDVRFSDGEALRFVIDRAEMDACAGDHSRCRRELGECGRTALR